MENILITEINLAARLFRSGIMKYLNEYEISLHMIDLCYYHKSHDYNSDKNFVKEMVGNEQIKIIGLNSIQLDEASKLYKRYYPKFLIKTVASILVAQELDYTIVSEDALLRETAFNDFCLNANDKNWLVDQIISKLDSKNNSVNTNMLRLVI